MVWILSVMGGYLDFGVLVLAVSGAGGHLLCGWGTPSLPGRRRPIGSFACRLSLRAVLVYMFINLAGNTAHNANRRKL